MSTACRRRRPARTACRRPRRSAARCSATRCGCATAACRWSRRRRRGCRRRRRVNTSLPAVASRPPDPPAPVTPGNSWRHDGLAGLVVDRLQRARPGADLADGLAGQPHRAARIGFGQVEDVEAVVLVDVEEARLRRERRRRPVRRRRLRPATRASPGMMASFAGFGSGAPFLRRPFAQLVVVPNLRRDDRLAGHAIEREEVAVARRGRNELARPAVDHAVDQDRRLRRVPVVRVVRRGLVVPGHLAGVDVERDQRAGEEVVAQASLRRCSRASGCRCR